MATRLILNAADFAANLMARNPHITVVLDLWADGTTVWHVTQRLDHPANPNIVTEYTRILAEEGIVADAFHTRFWTAVLAPDARSAFPRSEA